MPEQYAGPVASDSAVAEQKYRKASIIIIGVISLFWAAMTVWLIHDKIYVAYRKRNTVDYSLLFKEDSFRNYSSMEIILELGPLKKRIGFTKTVISEVPGGGRVIRGTTNVSLKQELLSGKFTMKSEMHISPEQKLDHFTFNVSQLKGPEISITGRVENGRLKVEIPALGYEEVLPLEDTIISSGISPFSDVISLNVGQSWELRLFDPILRRIKLVKVKVISKEDIQWKNQQESVYKLECRDEGGKHLATAWVDSYGRVLEEVIDLFGLTLRLRRHD